MKSKATRGFWKLFDALPSEVREQAKRAYCIWLDRPYQITVRLEESLRSRLESVSKRTGISRSDIVRDALKRQLALLAFETHRETAMPFAEARGFLTDEDVFSEVS